MIISYMNWKDYHKKIHVFKNPIIISKCIFDFPIKIYYNVIKLKFYTNLYDNFNRIV